MINTVGNALHYLGFGFCKDNGRRFNPEKFKKDKKITSVSGAAMLVSRSYYDKVGILDDDFFMYSEDQNYSWRGLLLGYSHYLSVGAVVYHSYSFSKNPFKMLHSEKNRVVMLLQNYQLSSLLFLIPIILIIELMLIIHSILYGWFQMKLKSYFYILRQFRVIKNGRHRIQQQRLIDDKVLIPTLHTELSFDALQNVMIENLLNPLLRCYHSLLVTLTK